MPYDETGKLLVRLAPRHFEKVLPVFLFRVGFDEHILRRVVHAAQIAYVHRVAAAPGLRRGFQKQDGRTGLAGHQGRTKGSVAPADDKDIRH